MSTFTKKGYGRIYCLNPDDVQAVKDEIKVMDEFEFGYLPKDLIAPFSEYPMLKYTHKFDALNLNLLTARLWQKGIYIFCLNNGRIEFVDEGEVKY